MTRRIAQTFTNDTPTFKGGRLSKRSASRQVSHLFWACLFVYLCSNSFKCIVTDSHTTDNKSNARGVPPDVVRLRWFSSKSVDFDANQFNGIALPQCSGRSSPNVEMPVCTD